MIDSDDIEFFGIFYKNKCMDVIRWRKSVALAFGNRTEPQIHDFHWSPGNKKNWKIERVKISIINLANPNLY